MIDDAHGRAYALLMMNASPEITVEAIEVIDMVTRSRTPMYVAHGPDGHVWLLKRLTADAAQRDGLTYFLATRKLDTNGRWTVAS